MITIKLHLFLLLPCLTYCGLSASSDWLSCCPVIGCISIALLQRVGPAPEGVASPNPGVLPSAVAKQQGGSIQSGRSSFWAA